MVAVAIGLAAWCCATLMPAAEPGHGVGPEWVDELRWGCVILAVLGLRAAALRRRGATLAALVLGGWLLAAAAVPARLSFMDGDALPGPVVGVVAAAGAGLAWLISGPRVRAGAPWAAPVWRGLVVVAVTAAACGPLLIASFPTAPTAPLPAIGLRVAMGVVPATFVALAVAAAAACRRRPFGPGRLALFTVVSVAVVAAGGVVTTATRIDQGVVLVVGAACAGLLAAGSAATALAGGAHTPLTKAGWAVAAALATVALAPVVLYTAIVPGILLRAIEGAAQPYSATISFQPGVLLVVVPAVTALAGWLRYPRARSEESAVRPDAARLA